MTTIFNAGLLEATRLTRLGRLTEATAAIRRTLGGNRGAVGVPLAISRPARPTPATIDGAAEPAQAKPAYGHGAAAPRDTSRLFPGGAVRMERAKPKHLRGSLGLGSRGGLRSPSAARVRLHDGATFLASAFGNDAGVRPYKLYVPSRYQAGQPVPLIVMLHGCTQSPDDFAAGTRMNDAAEEQTCLVLYPEQTASANMQKCWNWFSGADHERGRGEPSLIADMARQIMHDYAVDPHRVYVAGLSAGGAAAAIMGDSYPDLFAAIGVHSGLACGSAHDMPSAFAAMQGSGARHAPTSGSEAGRRIVPAIVFHGDQDRTVNPRNADAVVAQSVQAEAVTQCAEQGRAVGGHAYSRTLSINSDGQTVIEQWVVYGAGHAWSGGSAAGSYTDPKGPDATRHMLRFFLEHPHPAPGS